MLVQLGSMHVNRGIIFSLRWERQGSEEFHEKQLRSCYNGTKMLDTKGWNGKYQHGVERNNALFSTPPQIITRSNNELLLSCKR